MFNKNSSSQNRVNFKKTPKLSAVIYSLIIGFSTFNYADVYADSLKMTETQTEKLTCVSYSEDGEDYSECSTVTNGKFAITAKISAATFEENEILFADISEDTSFDIEIGNFIFTGTLAGADKRVLKKKSLKGTWHSIDEVCKYNPDIEDDVCKDVKHTTVNISASPSGAIIKVTGNSNQIDGEGYGNQIFTELCSGSEGNSTETATASISIGEALIESDVDVKCKVTAITKTKDEQDYELVNMTISAKLAPNN